MTSQVKVHQGPAGQVTHHRAALAMAVITSALAVLWAWDLTTDFGQPAYIMPIWVVVVAWLCEIPTVIGGAVAARSGRVTPALAPLGVSVLLVASLELFVFVIPIAVIVIALLILRAMRRAERLVPWTLSVGVPGLLLTIGLVPLFLLVFLGRPVVACTPGGGSSAIPIWEWFSSDSGFFGTVSGSSSGSSDGAVSTGTETVGGTTYAWVCDGSTVTHFTTNPA
jgi:hypothetical protein